jgi:hypothetical protein
MNRILLAIMLLLAAAASAAADEASACHEAAGSYVSGVVLSAPKFKDGGKRQGVELSHTHLFLRADQDGRTYDVAIDNVFAAGYDKAGKHVPAPLDTIRKGDRLSLCGQLYTSGGGGIHWVHTNCGIAAKPSQPDGWVKKLGPDGTPGDNLEGATEYCGLWP